MSPRKRRATATAPSCTFCGSQVCKVLIAGPVLRGSGDGIFICDECIGLCLQVVAERHPEALPSAARAPFEGVIGDLTEALSLLTMAAVTDRPPNLLALERIRSVMSHVRGVVDTQAPPATPAPYVGGVALQGLRIRFVRRNGIVRIAGAPPCDDAERSAEGEEIFDGTLLECMHRLGRGPLC